MTHPGKKELQITDDKRARMGMYDFEPVTSGPTPTPSSRGEAWQTMDSAPKDGCEFLGVERYPDGRVFVHVYKWEGHPNYWHCRRDGVCIRPDYQERFLWIALPAALSVTAKEGE